MQGGTHSCERIPSNRFLRKPSDDPAEEVKIFREGDNIAGRVTDGWSAYNNSCMSIRCSLFRKLWGLAFPSVISYRMDVSFGILTSVSDLLRTSNSL